MFFNEEDWEVDVNKNAEDTLLTLIKENVHDKMAKVLPGVNVNTFMRVGVDEETTPLLFAISENNLECVKILLSFNASADFGARLTGNDLKSFTIPLHHAITLDVSPEIIGALLESNVDLALKDGKDDTPLTLAISKGRKNIVKQLLQKGCSNISDDICWLIKMGRKIHLADWNDTGIGNLMYNGRNADQLANCACYNGHEEVLQSLKENNYKISKRYSCHINEPPIPFIEHNFTLLHVAVLGEQNHLIDFLIKNNCDVNAEDSLGNTSIHCAAFVGNVGLLEKLLFWKVDVEKLTRDGTCALYIAVKNAHVNFVQKLVDLGWFVAFEASRVKDKSRDKANDPLALSIFLKNYEITRLLLKSSGQFESLHELHYSINEGNAKLANLVINHLVDDSCRLKEDTIHGIPSLHLLSDARIMSQDDVNEFAALVRYYISKGYDINKRSINFKSKKRSAAGFTALLAAVDRKNFNLVKILIENGADVNAADDDGYSALHWCALVNDSSIMELLLSSGADCYAETKAGLPVIHVASDEGHLEVVQVLLRQDMTMINWKAKYIGFLQPDEVDKYPCRYNIDVMGDEEKFCTPFQRAVYMSKVDVCKLLIMSGSQLNGLEELHYSVRQGDIPIANVLLSYISMDTSLTNDEIKNEPALSCLPCRCYIDYTEDMPKFLHAYMMRGYDVNALSRKNSCQCESSLNMGMQNVSLLHLAVLHESLDMVEFLVDNGADINVCTEGGHTPLFLALYLKSQIFIALFERGADINKRGEGRRIISSCRCNDSCSCHRKIEDPSHMKLSPIGVAIYSHHKLAFKCLLNANAKLHGLEELNLAMKVGNVEAALRILKRIPNKTSLAQCFCGAEPLLHHLIKRCGDLDEPDVINTLRKFIKEYARRGYDVNFNGPDENVKPLLFFILEQCIIRRNSKMLDIITSVETWNPNIRYLGQSALRVFLNHLSVGLLNCNHKSQYGTKFCPLDCAITLLKYGADGTHCSVALTHFQHTTKWKILATFGVNVSFTDAHDDNTSKSKILCSFVEKANSSVKKLKHISRLAVRKIDPVHLKFLGVDYLPKELKSYLYLENLCSISNEQLSSLELDSSIYDSDSNCEI